MTRLRTLPLIAALLAGCTPDYSPDTYATRAVQQANKVEQGVIVGERGVAITAEGTVGAATGAAAGGAVGAQTPGGGVGTAFGTIGGALVGGLVGTAAEHAAGDTQATEYVVRKTNNDLLSVTQKDSKPLPIGTKVLVITGNQARIVTDYTTPATPSAENKPSHSDQAPKADATPSTPAASGPAPSATAPSATAPSAPSVPAAAPAPEPSSGSAPAAPAPSPTPTAAPSPAAPTIPSAASGAPATGAPP